MTHLHYTLDARNGRQHRFVIALELVVDAHHGDIEFLIPVWTPGSYLIREHERHLGDMRARDADTGTAVAWSKSAKNRFRFRVAPSTRRLRIEYTVFAHELTVRTADLTEEHAFWNGVCLFLWPVQEREASATIDVTVPSGWQVFSWLPMRRQGDGVQLAVRGLDQLADCPVLACAEARVVEFEVMGRPHRFVFDGLGGVEPPAELIPHTRAVIEEAAGVFGIETLPYPSYDFLTLVTDRGQGGLEHCDGSVLLASRTGLTTIRGYRDFLGLVAHEHFHVFNVKRMRPRELWQLDYEAENLTSLLWVAEGFTAYYDDLLCRRAGALSVAKYLQIIADNIADAHRTPGRLVHPLAEASYDAWIKFYRPDEDTKNSTQSYYANGGLAAMCLDLEIRRRTRGTRGLDDAMARLWRETYLQGRGYTHDDVVAALSHAAACDMSSSVDALVRGPFDPDLAGILRTFGLVLQAVKPTADSPAFLGVQFQPGTTVLASVQRDGAAARGGLAAGDEVLAVGGLRTTSAGFDEVVHAVSRPGRPTPVLFSRRGLVSEREVTPDPAESRVAFSLEVAADSTAEENAWRRNWLGVDR